MYFTLISLLSGTAFITIFVVCDLHGLYPLHISRLVFFSYTMHLIHSIISFLLSHAILYNIVSDLGVLLSRIDLLAKYLRKYAFFRKIFWTKIGFKKICLMILSVWPWMVIQRIVKLSLVSAVIIFITFT